MSATSWDVARAAGVSQSTVSRVFRNTSSVAAATRDRVLVAAERLSYVPDVAARSLITGRTQAIAMTVDDILNPVYPLLITVVQPELARLGYRMLLLRDRAEAPEELTELHQAAVDGVICASATLDSAVVRTLSARSVPTVLLMRDVRDATVDAFMPDHRGGCEAVAKHLFDLGHRRIAMITGPDQISSSGTRLDAFREALRSRGVPLTDDMVANGDLTYDSGRDVGVRLLDRHDRPTAIVTTNDMMAIGVLDAAKQRGLSVPDELSVAGFDDIPAAGWPMIDLTTVRTPFNDMARAAVVRLVELIDGINTRRPERVLSPVELVIRGTTGRVSAADASVADW